MKIFFLKIYLFFKSRLIRGVRLIKTVCPISDLILYTLLFLLWLAYCIVCNRVNYIHDGISETYLRSIWEMRNSIFSSIIVAFAVGAFSRLRVYRKTIKAQHFLYVDSMDDFELLFIEEAIELYGVEVIAQKEHREEYGDAHERKLVAEISVEARHNTDEKREKHDEFSVKLAERPDKRSEHSHRPHEPCIGVVDLEGRVYRRKSRAHPDYRGDHAKHQTDEHKRENLVFREFGLGVHGLEEKSADKEEKRHME